MATLQTLEGPVIRNAELRNGRPIMAGTGVTVRTVVGYYKLGMTPEEISDEMGVALSGVYGALAYYHLNREVIEADIQVNSEEAAMKPLNRD